MADAGASADANIGTNSEQTVSDSAEQMETPSTLDVLFHVLCENTTEHCDVSQLTAAMQDSNFDVNAVDQSQMTLLMTSVLRTQSEDDAHACAVRMLLDDKRIDVNQRNALGDAALHVVIGGGMHTLLSVLPTLVAEVEHNSSDEITTALEKMKPKPLMSVVGLKVLLNDTRCDVNMINYADQTPLSMALLNVTSENDIYADVTRLLLRHPRLNVNQQDSRGRAALHVACGSVNSQLMSTFGIKLLLKDERCDVNLADVTGSTALMLALCRIQMESDVYTQSAQMLLQHKAIAVNQCDEDEKTALHATLAAILAGLTTSTAGVRLVLQHQNCDVNALTDDGVSALMLAVLHVTSADDIFADVTRQLLADPRVLVNKQNDDLTRKCALHLACGMASTGVQSAAAVKLLLSHSACDVNIRSANGRNALSWAVEKLQSDTDQYSHIVRCLLEQPGINVNQQDDDGRTALHLACSKNIPSCAAVELLLKDHRCDVNIQASNGLTPLGYAILEETSTLR